MSVRFSVVIPVYNGAGTIGETLQSVFAQMHAPHEVIVVDDGSTDETPRILEGFGSKIIRRRIERGGPSEARNEGLRQATGDWLAFLDADDLWFRNRLQRQAEAIGRFPDIDFFCCNYAVRYDFLGFRMVKHFSILKRLKKTDLDAPLRKNAFGLLAAENFIGTSSSVVIRKSLADRVGPFNPAYRNSQDFDYWLRCALKSRIVILSDALLYKRAHQANWSSNKFRHYEAHRRILLDTMEREREAISRMGLGGVFREAVAATTYAYGNAHYESGEKKAAFRLYVEGLRFAPTPANWVRFAGTVLRKGVRTLSGGALSRRNWERVF